MRLRHLVLSILVLYVAVLPLVLYFHDPRTPFGIYLRLVGWPLIFIVFILATGRIEEL